MKFRINLNTLLLACFVSACTNAPEEQNFDLSHVDYSRADSLILMEVFDHLSAKEGASLNELVVETGRFFLGTPYVGKTLDPEGEERLIINLRELDCTTYGENCLAIARTVHSGEPSFVRYTDELLQIRYREGELAGYTSRLHYFCDWIHNNSHSRLVEDMTAEWAAFPLEREINFMSTHPQNYWQLAADSTLVEKVIAQEALINAREMFYIPEEELADFEEKIVDGDILAITTHIEGLAIQHVTVAVWKEGRVHILHASSAAKEVVLSETPLEDYLLQNERASGIMVVRPV